VSIVAVIATDLSVDGAAMPSKVVSYVTRAVPLLSQRRDCISFFTGDVVVTHGFASLVGRLAKRPLCRITHLFAPGVALSILIRGWLYAPCYYCKRSRTLSVVSLAHTLHCMFRRLCLAT